MSDLPPPPPAAVLVREAREMAIPKRSRPQVAHRVGIDPGTLGNIERGYRHLGDGRTRLVEADATTLAKLARELGITPEDLAGRGERPDAAEILRAESGRPAGPRPDITFAADPAEDAAAVLFPGDRAMQAIWRLPEPVEVREALVGELRRLRRETGNRGVSLAEDTA